MLNIDINEFNALKKDVLMMKRFFYIPKFISLVDVADDIGISRQTLKYHLNSKYRDGIDYKLKNGKIVIDVSILQNIKATYEK